MIEAKISDPHGKIYLGYRRANSLWQAYTIYYFLLLKNRLVYKDWDDNRRGAWQSEIEDLIKASTHYLLILDPITFRIERFSGGEDKLLREIEVALLEKKNFVQIWFDFDPKKDTPDVPNHIIEGLILNPAWRIKDPRSSSFTAELNRLYQSMLINKPLTETPLPEQTAKHVLAESVNRLLAELPSSPNNWDSFQKTILEDDDFRQISSFLGFAQDNLISWLKGFYQNLRED